MSTEYRRGVPSREHIEAATRSGLLWQSESDRVWKLTIQHDRVVGDWHEITELTDIVRLSWLSVAYDDASFATRYRPIRPDGTPVDWSVLDVEVARAAGAAVAAQPQGFREDLWRLVGQHFSLVFRSHNQVSNLSEISDIDTVGIHARDWQWPFKIDDSSASRDPRNDADTDEESP